VKPPIPILRSFSETEARGFYLGYLGFAEVFAHRFGPGMPLYLAVRRGDCDLHLSEHHGDATPGSALRIEVADLDGFLAEIGARPHPRLRPSIEDMPWGFRELRLVDPFGNRLVICQRVPAAGG